MVSTVSPAPSAAAEVGTLLATVIFRSVTSRVAVFSEVVVPVTTRLPLMVRLAVTTSVELALKAVPTWKVAALTVVAFTVVALAVVTVRLEELIEVELIEVELIDVELTLPATTLPTKALLLA